MKKHLKALTCFALSLCLLTSSLLTARPVSAESPETTVVSEETVQMEDGSYCIITTTEKIVPSVTRGTTKTKSADKSYNYYNSNNQLSWSYTLHGTFMYDDYLVVCSDVSHTVRVVNTLHWIYKSGKRWKSGNTAYGTATFHLISSTANKTVNLKISCSKHGVIS